MRPKAFKARPQVFRPEEFATPEDDALGFESALLAQPDGTAITVIARSGIANTVIKFRAMRIQATPDPEEKRARPSRADTRETLSTLSGLTPIEAAQKWRELDAEVKARINYAALVRYRKAKGQDEKFSFSWPKSGPENLPELAKIAIQKMDAEQATGGRPQVTRLAEMFAAALATHWFLLHSEVPKVASQANGSDPTKFQLWAWKLFGQAGYPVADIYGQLQSGIREAKKTGRIPAK